MSTETNTENASSRFANLKGNQEGRASNGGTKEKRIGYRDYGLVFAIIFLVLFGLMMVYSSSYYYAENAGDSSTYYLVKQSLWAAFGFAFMFLIAKFINYKKLINPYTVLTLFFICLILMVLVDFTSFGAEVNGSKRWLKIGGVTVGQPTELVKVWVILFLASTFHEKKELFFAKNKGVPFYKPYEKNWFWPIFLVLIPFSLVVINNLSSGIIVFLITYLMLMIAAPKKKVYVVLICVAIAGYIVLYFFGEPIFEGLNHIGFLKDYQLNRIYAWLEPESDPTGVSYQVVQGLYAIGSGGLFGKGLGNSTQKLGFIPEAQNDMIFSIVCEELGIFGAICLMALYVFLIYRMYKLAKSINYARDIKGYFIVVGVMLHLSLQVILNICVVTSLIPNTGVTLPFISYGGSSLFITLCEMGLVLSVAKRMQIKPKKRVAIQDDI